MKKLEDRKYPQDLITSKFEKAKSKERGSLIYQKRKNTLKGGKVRFMFTHTSANPPIRQWVRAAKKKLLRNDQAKKIGGRIQIGSKQTKNLQRIDGGYKDSGGMEKSPPDAGCSKCNKCKVVCPVLKVKTHTKHRLSDKN